MILVVGTRNESLKPLIIRSQAHIDDVDRSLPLTTNTHTTAYIGDILAQGKRVQRDVYVKVHSAQDQRERGVQTGNFYSRRDKHELTDKVETRHSGAGIDDGAER